MKKFQKFVLVLLTIPISLFAQNFRLSPGDTLQSVSVASDGTTILRIFAPLANNVRIGGTDIPESFRNQPMVKQPTGVWETPGGMLPAGAYRYTFIIDSVSVMDPKNPSVSESNANSWSMFTVPGSDFMETKNVPHGAVAEVTYYSQSLQRNRRMHIYTPPGYQSSNKKYPVLFLLHGAMDCDDSWTSVGRAGFILDNLFAENNAVPMIVVMPAGHTGPFSFGAMRPSTRDEFVEDFLNDIKPYVEKNYRTLTDRKHRAIAGLSMGGLQTLNIAIPHLEEYSAIGVFSSGIFELGGINFGATPGQSWEERNLQMLQDKGAKKGLRLFWFATGREDFLVNVSQKTVDLLTKHNFTVVYKVTDGAHTWAKWRDYLYEFAPQLFK